MASLLNSLFKKPRALIERMADSILGVGVEIYQAPSRPPDTRNIAQKHFNPGNLIYMEQPGAVQGEQKDKNIYWAKFPDEAAGFLAFQKDIEVKAKRNPKMSVKDLILKRSPVSENDYKTLAYNVMDDLKDLKDKGQIPSLLAGQLSVSQVPIDRLMQALAKAEGFYAKINP